MKKIIVSLLMCLLAFVGDAETVSSSILPSSNCCMLAAAPLKNAKSAGLMMLPFLADKYAHNDEFAALINIVAICLVSIPIVAVVLGAIWIVLSLFCDFASKKSKIAMSLLKKRLDERGMPTSIRVLLSLMVVIDVILCALVCIYGTLQFVAYLFYAITYGLYVRQKWTRWTITSICALICLGSILEMIYASEFGFFALALVIVAIQIAVILSLWLPSTSAWFSRINLNLPMKSSGDMPVTKEDN